ncbi:protein of unknown function [Bartonella clarridgeiae 73]|uniref:Uncharacterized protein n=1 Tax=Bartonella clarridgeiae (strain CCUG 45776 / CIP 104772 / 73) TaxID=696125 RepID=E6YJC9_BARC7|nr:protein of unknown function [Bartonella clarridgeiae 73]
MIILVKTVLIFFMLQILDITLVLRVLCLGLMNASGFFSL